MTIHEYYRDYDINSQYRIAVPTGSDTSIEGFYKHCISKNNLNKADVLKWHKMFMDYVERPDAIFWIRYHEDGQPAYKKAHGVYNNRRACLTRMKGDGFSYVFVSNHDVHEIFNMISLGVEADVDEFADMMQHRTPQSVLYTAYPDAFPMHYDRNAKGKSTGSCEEALINCYPNIGTPRNGVLGLNQQWYLAHIIEIKSKYKRENGEYKALSRSEVQELFPRGSVSDWKCDASGLMIRELDGTLSDEQKAIVKAHFLRFVDPLNYYAAPGKLAQKNETPYAKSKAAIGEYDPLNLFMAQQFETLYGKAVMEEFRKAVLVDFPSDKHILNVTYAHDLNKKPRKGSKPKKAPSSKATATSGKGTGATASTGVGSYAKTVFTKLLTTNQLTPAHIKDLTDQSFCSNSLGISYAVLVEDVSGVQPARYYRGSVSGGAGKFFICREWTDKRNCRTKIDAWILKNGFIL